jgi:hypothetical protein
MKTSLSEENINLAVQYGLGNDAEFDKLGDGYKNIFLSILGDINSSMLRERAVLQFLNYENYDSKNGMDGYCPITNKQKEVKPCFITEGKKITYSGKFNDMTSNLLNKKDGCDIICAGFYEGRFLYIVEFPYELIKPILQQKVDNAVVGRRVQADFGWNTYDDDSLKIWYFNEKLINDTNSLSKPHLEMLKRRFKA